ncbi:MAG: hypothetical protein ACLUI3_10785 [Christensenellales bacterium]
MEGYACGKDDGHDGAQQVWRAGKSCAYLRRMNDEESGMVSVRGDALERRVRRLTGRPERIPKTGGFCRAVLSRRSLAAVAAG